MVCDPDAIRHVIGVIDLLGGKAVHAVAGLRNNYRSVAFCDGDPIALAAHYRSLGVSGLYFADLDSIQNGPLQSDPIRSLCEQNSDVEIMLDVGWTGSRLQEPAKTVSQLAGEFPNTSWIAATESAVDFGAIAALGDLVSAHQVLVGMDFRDGKLLAPKGKAIDWIERAMEARCNQAVVLDLASVGVAKGPKTMAMCTQWSKEFPELNIYSGGGVRSSDDVEALLQAGCQRCLAATALHKQT